SLAAAGQAAGRGAAGWGDRRWGDRAREPFREPAGPFRVRTGGEHRELGRAEAADHIRQPRGRFDRLHGAAQVHPTRWLDVEREHDAGEWTVLPERLRSELPRAAGKPLPVVEPGHGIEQAPGAGSVRVELGL